MFSCNILCQCVNSFIILTLFQTSGTEKKVVVVSVSPQSRASLAAHYDLSSTEAGRRLTSFFKGLGECRCYLYILAVKQTATHKNEGESWTLSRHNHLWRFFSLWQEFIMCLTRALVAPSACLRASESLWSVSRGRSRTTKVCPWWHRPVQVVHWKPHIKMEQHPHFKTQA